MKWDLIALNDVLQMSKTFTPILDRVEYQYAALHPYPYGLRLRGQKRGTDFRGKRHQVIRTGQFVISRVRMQQHFWGMVAPELDAAIVHRSYACFDLHPAIHPTYFAAYIGTRDFRQAMVKSQTQKGRLDVRRFGRILIPKPSAKEQAYIADIWENAVNVFTHTNEMYASIAALKSGMANELFQKIRPHQARLLGDWISIGKDYLEDCAVYFKNNGQLVKGEHPAQDVAFGITAKGDLDNHYLYYYLEHSKSNWQKNIQATGFTAEAAIQALPIDVPTLYEQRKIVTVLQQHEDALHKLKAELHELRHLTSGMMQLIFSGKMPYNEALRMMQNLLD